MNDTLILLFLFFITLLFILIFFGTKLYFNEKRHFTFEIITIPLGIFKFDKRDEYIKDKVGIISKQDLDSKIKISDNENGETLKVSEILEESYDNAKEFNSILNEDKLLIKNKSIEEEIHIVYWTSGGKAYHTSKKCRTLARSKSIFNGTKEESGKELECIHCK